MAVCLLTLSLSCYSQETEDTKPEITFLKFQRSKFILLDEDKMPVKRGLSKNDMEGLLEGNTEALKHYYKFRKLRTMKHVTRSIALAGAVTSIVFISSSNYQTQDIGYGVLSGSILFMVGVQLPIAISAGSQAGKAVDEHNMIMSKNKKMYSLYIGATSTGIGLALNF